MRHRPQRLLSALPVLLLLLAADVNTGVPESDMLDAELDIRGMNAMGYDAMAVGNHEFDNPLDTLRRQERLMYFPCSRPTSTTRTGGAPSRPTACSNCRA